MGVPSTTNLVLFLGADWWGSDARALAVAARRLGHGLLDLFCGDGASSRQQSRGIKR